MGRICLYYVPLPQKDRWFTGDRYIRAILRRLIRGKKRYGGVDKVFLNLCKGLNLLKIPYVVNLPFRKLKADDSVGVLGLGSHCLEGYVRKEPILAGIGLMTHPSEWPDLCKQYPVYKYLQHCQWALDVYKPYFGDKCAIWPVGIDTDEWSPDVTANKSIDFLVYNKIRWNHAEMKKDLLDPIYKFLEEKKLSFQEIVYGSYKPEDFKQALTKCKGMIFICEHESQGLAYQEALSAGVPILAWDQGLCLDPNRFKWGTPQIPASSVPYWDDRCGVKFRHIEEFPQKLQEFIDKLESKKFFPRDYILENLTLVKGAKQYIKLLNEM